MSVCEWAGIEPGVSRFPVGCSTTYLPEHTYFSLQILILYDQPIMVPNFFIAKIRFYRLIMRESYNKIILLNCAH